mmetsp:Transcript_29168/g.49738  ORF Transcript_29168/g.49738 Transcript_29168/m.49738 type:complete len:265 (+) Transcript_29168:114-908(+)
MKLSLASIVATAGCLSTFPDQSEANQVDLLAQIRSGQLQFMTTRFDFVGRSRQLLNSADFGRFGETGVFQFFEGERRLVEGEAPPPFAFVVNATGLAPDCIDCKAGIFLSKFLQCNSTNAHDAALMIPLEDELTYTTNNEGSTDGWETTPMRELPNTNSTPMSLADFMATDVVVEEVDNEVTENNFNLAVYLYDSEENPIACATLGAVSEEEKAAYYDEIFSSVDEGGDAATLADDSPSGGFMLASVSVVGVSFIMIGIFLVTV